MDTRLWSSVRKPECRLRPGPLWASAMSRARWTQFVTPHKALVQGTPTATDSRHLPNLPQNSYLKPRNSGPDAAEFRFENQSVASIHVHSGLWRCLTRAGRSSWLPTKHGFPAHRSLRILDIYQIFYIMATTDGKCPSTSKASGPASSGARASVAR